MVVLREGMDMARVDTATRERIISNRIIRRKVATVGSRNMRRRAEEMAGSMRLQVLLALRVVRF